MTEVAKATAADGYSAFTTRYLERLSHSANISLQATNNINLDLKGDTLSLASGRDLTLTAGNNITSASAGTIRTAGTGSILLSAGSDINLSHDLDLAADGSGSVTLRANNSILYSGGGDISTQGGAITLNSDRDASGAGAISLGSGTLLTSNGGNITLGGGSNPLTTAARGTASNVQGIRLVSAMLNAQGGNISLLGQGNAASTVNDFNNSAHGLFMSGSAVQTNGAGTITAMGLGGGAASSGFNIGAYIYSGSTISGVNGAITIDGTGGQGSQGNNIGVSISGTGANVVQSTGGGSISILGTGNGSAGASNDGIHLNSAAGGILSASGSVAVTGTRGAGTAFGVSAANPGFTLGGAFATGDITLTGDHFSLGGNVTTRTSGTVTIRPYTASTSIGIGGAAGTLGITSAMLNRITAGTLTIGRSDGTGLMRVAGVDLSARNYHLSLINGSGNIQLDGGVTALALAADRNFSTATTSGNITAPTATGTITTTRTGSGGNVTMTAGGSGNINLSDVSLNATGGGQVSLSAGGSISVTQPLPLNLGTVSGTSVLLRTTNGTADITLNGTVTGSGAGNAITLASGRNFINNAGSGALSTPSGRWLVYSTNPANDTIGSLSNAFRRFSCTYGGSCPSFPASGNGFLYGSTPLLMVNPTGGFAVTYGDLTPNLSGYAYTLSGYLDFDSASEAVTGSLNGSTPYAAGSNIGSYAIHHTSGTLSSEIGYGFSYVSNATGITVAPRTLTASLTGSVRKVFDGTTAASLKPANYLLPGVFSGDSVSLNFPATGRFASSEVGTGKLVTVFGLALTGADVGNYLLASGSVSGPVGTIEGSLGAGEAARVQLSQQPSPAPSGFVYSPANGHMEFISTPRSESPSQVADLDTLAPSFGGYKHQRPNIHKPQIMIDRELQIEFDLPPSL